MDIKELSKYAYIKRPLNEQFQSVYEVPYEFLLEWLKETFDYQRIHSEEEIKDFVHLEPKDILKWLEDTQRLIWEVKKLIWLEKKYDSKTL